MHAPTELPPTLTGPATLTAQDAIRAAAALRPRILAEAAETESRSYYSAGIHDALMESGLYDVLRPARYDGYQLDLTTWSRVVRELARGDMSTAWCYTLASAHILWMASWWPQEVQDEVFSARPALAAGTFAPGGTLARTEGGWILNGSFPYASGSPYSSHFVGHAFLQDGDAPPVLGVFLIPRSAWTSRDDWGNLLGLKGSGSHTLDVVDAFVPDGWVLPNVNISLVGNEGGTPGLHLHGEPLYNARGIGLFSIELCSVGVGAVRGALDEYAEVLRTKRVALPPFSLRSEDPTYQRWYAEAATLLDRADSSIDAATQLYAEYTTRAADGTGEFTPTDDVRISRLAFSAQEDAWRALESIIVRTIGSSGLTDGSRIQRIWRDMSMLHGHQNSVLQQVTAAGYGEGRIAADLP